MRYSGNHLRFAIVTDVDYDTGIMRTQWLDNNLEPGQDVPIPHPAPGRGDGIYYGVRPGALVALGIAAYERYVPLAIVPTRGFYSDNLSTIPEMRFDDVGFPPLREGEICLQGITGSRIYFDEDGSLALMNSFLEGTVLGGDHDAEHRCSIIRVPPVEYTISETGISALGVVRRDIRMNENDFDTAAVDPMFDLAYEYSLEEVGRDPHKALALSARASSGTKSQASQTDQFRNPGFIEHRRILNEFGTSWLVDSQKEEEELLLKGRNTIPVRNSEERRERRNNVLSLSLAYPNELMETVEGTLVDLFGNLLDANRHILPRLSDKKAKEWLASAIENAQHTIVYHREINTRKGWAYRSTGLKNLRQDPDPKLPSDSSNNARDRSRWFIDVDKEGLTKINIPATSETGTVPVLARYETSSSVVVDDKGNAKKTGRNDDNVKGLFRSAPEKGKERRDIFLDQFGPGGIQIVSDDGKGRKGTPVPPNRLSGEKTSHVESTKQDTLPTTMEAGTAFHDITKTALALLTSSINKKSTDAEQQTAPIAAKDDPAIHNKVNRVVPLNKAGTVSLDAAGRPKNAPNAGGRSVQLNLDGSLEMSIGANTVDRVSWVVDTAGALVARIGRDRLGRSAIVHMDGTLALEVGGFDFIGTSSKDTTDTRFVGGGRPRSGLTGSLPKDENIFRSGKVVIRVRRANATGTDADGDDQLIIIDEDGISIESSGRLNLRSKGNMMIKSDAFLTLDARGIQFYEDVQKFVLKTDRKIV